MERGRPGWTLDIYRPGYGSLGPAQSPFRSDTWVRIGARDLVAGLAVRFAAAEDPDFRGAGPGSAGTWDIPGWAADWNRTGRAALDLVAAHGRVLGMGHVL